MSLLIDHELTGCLIAPVDDSTLHASGSLTV